MANPQAIIVDLDGCLAILNGRNPYTEQNLAGQDELNETLAKVIRYFNTIQVEIIIITGRWEQYEPLTRMWLTRNNIPFSILYMRPNTNYDSATRMKAWYLENLIAPKYDVILAFDDLYANCKMFREHSVPAWQTNFDPYILSET